MRHTQCCRILSDADNMTHGYDNRNIPVNKVGRLKVNPYLLGTDLNLPLCNKLRRDDVQCKKPPRDEAGFHLINSWQIDWMPLHTPSSTGICMVLGYS